jgi:hypothetical protein
VDDAKPRQVLVGGGEDAADQARRFGVDVAVGAHRAGRDALDAPDDLGHARAGRRLWHGD